MKRKAQPGVRRLVRELIVDAIWHDAPDEDIAEHVGCQTALVIEARAELRRCLSDRRVVSRLERLASIVDWPGTGVDLLVEVLDNAIIRAEDRGGKHPNPHAQALREQMKEHARQRELAQMETPCASG